MRSFFGIGSVVQSLLDRKKKKNDAVYKKNKTSDDSVKYYSTILLILVTLLMLNVWAIPAYEVLSANINTLEELGKTRLRIKLNCIQ